MVDRVARMLRPLCGEDCCYIMPVASLYVSGSRVTAPEDDFQKWRGQ